MTDVILRNFCDSSGHGPHYSAELMWCLAGGAGHPAVRLPAGPPRLPQDQAPLTEVCHLPDGEYLIQPALPYCIALYCTR
jgi:hypothetical protein